MKGVHRPLLPGLTPTLDAIRHAVAYRAGVAVSELDGYRRSSARTRQLAMWAMYRMTNASYPQIGRAMGGRDHTTIMHGVARVAALIQVDAALAADADAVVAAFAP
jgi:chromosomal replication initiator protein